MEREAIIHPADETLVSYGLGKLDDTLAESVGKHLERCDPCRNRVAELSSDSFLGRLQEAKVPNASPIDEKPDQESKSAAVNLAPTEAPVRSAASTAGDGVSKRPRSPERTEALPPELLHHPQYE